MSLVRGLFSDGEIQSRLSLVSGFWFLVFGFMFLVSDQPCLMSGSRLQWLQEFPSKLKGRS